MKRKQMPGLVVMTMPGTDTKADSAGKQYVDSVSSVVYEVSLKNKFLIVDVNQHISKQSITRASKLWLQASYRIRMHGVDGVISDIYEWITQVATSNRNNVEMYEPRFPHSLAGLWEKAIANLE